MDRSCSIKVRQQFTQKERDIETGLDYLDARYYASTQGRFTGADPYDVNFERQETRDPEQADALFSKYIAQPQHWNHYSYTLNNPLKYVDPDGLMEEVSTDIPYPGISGSTFMMTQRFSETEDPETLPAAFIHEAVHAYQIRQGSPTDRMEMEIQASAFTWPILEKLGMSQRIIEAFKKDAKEGHEPWRPMSRPPKKKSP